MTEARRPPVDIEAERAVLGAALIDPHAYALALDHVKAEEFYRAPHQDIWRAMGALALAGKQIDPVTVRGQMTDDGTLDRLGDLSLSGFMDDVPSLSAVETYAKRVREKAKRRAMIWAAQEAVLRGYEDDIPTDEYVDSVQRALFEAIGDGPRNSMHTAKDVMRATFEGLKARYERRGEGITGLTTGFADLDALTLGLQPTDLIILAARPSMGKTTLAMNIATNAAALGAAHVLVWSLEMGAVQLGERMIASEGRIDHSKVRSGFINDTEWLRVAGAVQRVAALGLHIEETAAASVLEVRSRAQRLRIEGKLDLLVVDYLQLMRGSGKRGQNREQEISEISRGLKALAKELRVPVVALSQLNRGLESRADKRPMMSDLRESGAIEQDADVIMFVYRDEVYNAESQDKGTAEIIIAKHRSGPTGTVKLRFDGTISRFENLARGER